MTGAIHPEPDAIAAFASMDWDGPVNMVNLLKFADKASYDDGTECTGREAYATYGGLTGPFLQSVGGKPIFRGDVAMTLIGEASEDWDEVIIVQYPSKDAFIEMTSNPDYLAISHHRTAALARSALLPTKATL